MIEELLARKDEILKALEVCEGEGLDLWIIEQEDRLAYAYYEPYTSRLKDQWDALFAKEKELKKELKDIERTLVND